jgi:threonine dehydratase
MAVEGRFTVSPNETGSTPLQLRSAADAVPAPTLASVLAAADRLAPHIVRTPVHRWQGPASRRLFGAGTEVWVKLELLQVTGSFKPRGALNVAMNLDPAAREHGLTAFSSGNHAAAVAYAAQILGTTAKVVMLSSANPARVENCRRLGGEVLFATDGVAAMAMVETIRAQEGRALIHPYEGPHTSTGTGTLALELAEQIPSPDCVIVAIGGGGLCSGVAATMKQLVPACRVLAVEPVGADTMFRSFRSGKPEAAGVTSTIADSLSPPYVLPYSFGLCRDSVDELALVSDDEMCKATAVLFSELKLAVEPGGAASTAGALGPFREQIEGKRVVIVVCGSNIDIGSLSRLLKPGRGTVALE